MIVFNITTNNKAKMIQDSILIQHIIMSSFFVKLELSQNTIYEK